MPLYCFMIYERIAGDKEWVKNGVQRVFDTKEELLDIVEAQYGPPSGWLFDEKQNIHYIVRDNRHWGFEMFESVTREPIRARDRT